MPSRPDRIRVWRGELKRTKGGLTKADLMKNKSGKIVSRRRSAAAKGNSNLGNWLRKKGQKFTDKPRKVQTEAEKDAERAEIVKQFMAKHGNKKKAAPKKAPPKKAPPKKAPPKKAAPKKAPPKKARPVPIDLTDEPIDLTDAAEPAQSSNISVKNVRRRAARRKPRTYEDSINDYFASLL